MAPFIFYIEFFFGLIIFIYFVCFDGFEVAEKFRDVCINDKDCRKYLNPSAGIVGGWGVKLLNNAEELLEKPTLDGRIANPWPVIRDVGRTLDGRIANPWPVIRDVGYYPHEHWAEDKGSYGPADERVGIAYFRDNGDIQWRQMEGFLPLLFIAAVALAFLHHSIVFFFPKMPTFIAGWFAPGKLPRGRRVKGGVSTDASGGSGGVGGKKGEKKDDDAPSSVPSKQSTISTIENSSGGKKLDSLEAGTKGQNSSSFSLQQKHFEKLRARYPPYWRALRRRNSLFVIGTGFVLYLHGVVGFCWIMVLVGTTRLTAMLPYGSRFCSVMIALFLFGIRDYPVLEEYVRTTRAGYDSGMLTWMESLMRVGAILILDCCTPIVWLLGTMNKFLLQLGLGSIPHLGGVYGIPSAIRFLVIKILSFGFDSASAHEESLKLRERSEGRDAWILARLRILGAKRRAREYAGRIGSSSSEVEMHENKEKSTDDPDYLLVSSGMRKRPNAVTDDVLGGKGGKNTGGAGGDGETPVVDDATVLLELLQEVTEKPEFAMYHLSPAVQLSEDDPKIQEEKRKRQEEQTLLLKMLLPRFSTFNYLAYMFFPPLYIAGPLMGYEEFLDRGIYMLKREQKVVKETDKAVVGRRIDPQDKRFGTAPSAKPLRDFGDQGPSKSALKRSAHLSSGVLPSKGVGLPDSLYEGRNPLLAFRFYFTISFYAWRWILWYLCFDFFLHYLPVYALVRGNVVAKLVEEGGDKTHLAIKLSYWILPVLWMKFLLLWRFFRLWSLMMGVDCLENMPVFYNNCNSLQSFWRGWHVSFNNWLMKYLYLPLGGNKTRKWNLFPIFLFVALWHDLQIQYFAWGLFNATLMVFEQQVRSAWMKRIPAAQANKRFHYHFRLWVNALWGLIICLVNSIGYGLGLEQSVTLVKHLFTPAAFYDGCWKAIGVQYMLFLGCAYFPFHTANWAHERKKAPA